MVDQYDISRTRYDALVKDLVPKLTGEKADVAVRAINNLVYLERPEDWASADWPQAILGVTSDGEKAVSIEF